LRNYNPNRFRAAKIGIMKILAKDLLAAVALYHNQ
jgi:hypothetical protein